MTHPLKIGPYDPTLSDEEARKQRKLLRYQEEGIQRAISERTKGILLADDMGAGKTSSATEVALRLGVERVLIIAPRDALDQWVEVFDAQSDGAVKVRKMASTKAGRAAFADFLAGKPGYYATNIQWLVAQNYEYKPFFEDDGSPRWKRKKSTGELILKDGEPVQETERVRLLTFVKMKPVDLTIFDEFHAIQNRNALATRTAYTIKSEWRMGLSGTWHGNSFAGAWSTAGWVWPGEYENGESIVDASFNRWVRDYCEVKLACPKCYHPVDEADATRCEQCYLTFTKAKPPIRTVIGEKVEGEFVKTLPCYIRREPFPKAPKPAIVRVDISPEQREQYTQLEEDAIAWVQDHDGIEQPIVAELPIVLRQRLRTATLAEMSGTVEGEIFFADDCRSAKMTALRGILDKWSADAGQTEPALIFADSKPFVKVLAKRMASAGYRAREWTGDLSAKQREALKQEFIAGEFDYLVATIQSLNEAVDGLQFRCSKIAWVSKSENEVLNQQAERRIWRPGVDMSAFQQVEIRANDTLDEGTFSRLAQTRARNLRQMALDGIAS